MLGKRRQDNDLFDVGYVYDVALNPKSFHGQLAVAAPSLFRDEDFANLYKRGGRPSVPPSQLALLTLLQHHAGVSDEEAVERTCWDARWAAVLGTHLGEPLCAKSTLQLFRGQLIIHDSARAVFQKSLQLADEKGLLKGKLRIAVDTKPIFGQGAVLDTYNLIAIGIRQLCKALTPKPQRPDEWSAKHGLRRYFDGSIKGSVEIDWSDAEARRGFLAEIVNDARRLLRLTESLRKGLPAKQAASVKEAAQLLSELLLQDIVDVRTTPEPPSGPPFVEPPLGEPPLGEPPSAELPPTKQREPGETTSTGVEIRQGFQPGRKPSATDPEQRHGHKSKSKLFTGHKASVAVDVESQIIVGVSILSGDAPDDEGLLKFVEEIETSVGLEVAQTIGDCAYGSGARRAEFLAAERELIAKTPQDTPNRGRFTKSAFTVTWGDARAIRVGCPGGRSTEHFIVEKGRGQIFRFGKICEGCPLREQCTGEGGRTLRVHPQEPLLQAARALQTTAKGREMLRRRVTVEHGLARLGHLGIGKARYRGKQKTLFQLLMAATVANLRFIWNQLIDLVTWVLEMLCAPLPRRRDIAFASALCA